MEKIQESIGLAQQPGLIVPELTSSLSTRQSGLWCPGAYCLTFANTPPCKTDLGFSGLGDFRKGLRRGYEAEAEIRARFLTTASPYRRIRRSNPSQTLPAGVHNCPSLFQKLMCRHRQNPFSISSREVTVGHHPKSLPKLELETLKHPFGSAICSFTDYLRP